MDYPCASRFGFTVRTDRQTDRLTDVHDCYTHVTTVGESTWL